MFSHIRTSKENKEIVTRLTNKFNLGAENVIARIALAYSLAQGELLNLGDMQDAAGKEYSRQVLFGDADKIYEGMICIKHSISRSDISFAKYVKLYLDDGLKKISKLEIIDFNSFNLINQLIENHG